MKSIPTGTNVSRPLHRSPWVCFCWWWALVLRNQLRLECAAAVSRNRQLQRLVLRQYRLLAVAISMITGLLNFRNLILRRIRKVMVHLSIQNSLSQSLLQLPEQSV